MIYRVIIALLWPFALLARLIGGESLADLAERLGLGKALGAPVLWLHGASNGELTSARWLVALALEARPDLTVLVTCNTRTARAMVQGWQMPGVTAALAPLDTGLAIRAYVRRHEPLALWSLEAELWPNRFAFCASRGLPVLMLGARMSERSFRAWTRLGGLARSALTGVRYASAQDDASRLRLVALGLPKAAIGPDFDLKAEAVARQPRPQQGPREQRAGWLLAASTHVGEDEIVVDGFVAARLTHLILAPRHPSRGDAIAAMLTKRGLDFQRRSQGGLPGAARVLLADTMGEMEEWYARCGICFIGGTLADKGGHTPWEPARHGCALLHGPSRWNFAAPFAAFDAAGAALAVTDASLGAVLGTLDGSHQDQMARAAEAILQAKRDSDAYFHEILKYSGL